MTSQAIIVPGGARELIDTVLPKLVPAMEQVLSHGWVSDMTPGGQRVGVLHFSQARIQEVSAIVGIEYSHHDAFLQRTAEHMCIVYLQYHGVHAGALPERTEEWGANGAGTSLPAGWTDAQWLMAEKLARLWQGGPTDWTKEPALVFWGKVQTALRQEAGVAKT
jgi:hypothetical protein